MNQILASMSAHRSVRSFLDTEVPDAHIREAVQAARLAATSSWIQAYSLLQVCDPGEREQLAEWTGGQPQVSAAGAFFVVCADTRRHRLVAERLDKPYTGNLETFLLAVTDATLFAQNLA
ncbi:MAG: NADPH-dependent oxidoreductase, partial [Planctomycetota bacterium]